MDAVSHLPARGEIRLPNVHENAGSARNSLGSFPPHRPLCLFLFLTDFVYVHVLLILLSCSGLHCNKLRFKGERPVGGRVRTPARAIFFLG